MGALMLLHAVNYQQGNSVVKNKEESFALISSAECHFFSDEEVKNISLSAGSIYEHPFSKENYSKRLSSSVRNNAHKTLPNNVPTAESFRL